MSKYLSSKNGRRKRADAEINLDSKIDLKLRFWFERKNKTFLASGRVELLKKIEETKSISKAARLMKISYRHAWLLLNQMNRIAEKPLIKTKRGGKTGGVTILTEEGKKLIKKFETIGDKLRIFLRKDFK